MQNKTPRVIIACTSYNHEKFIAQALDSFVMQKLNEPFQVYIQDDASTDNTIPIIKEYEKKYPDIIKATYQPHNLFKQGLTISRYALFPSIHAEYVALCEGDDYFTDPYKLQKQVDFLDNNKEYSICFHPVRVVNDNGEPDTIFPLGTMFLERDTFTLEDLLEANFIQTNSCMYRWRFNDYDKAEELIPENIMPCDHFWHLLHAEKGKIKMLPDIMGVYNKHSSGMWTGALTTPAWYKSCALLHINFYTEIEKRYQLNFLKTKIYIAQTYLIFTLKENNTQLILQFFKHYPELAILTIKSLFEENNDQSNNYGKILLELYQQAKHI